jgi:CubicO group peptidase (beta-lactamase class C family)
MKLLCTLSSFFPRRRATGIGFGVAAAMLLATGAGDAFAQATAPATAADPAAAQSVPAYVPPKGSWERRTPAELGFDPAKLAEAMAWAKQQVNDMPKDFSTQAKIFGTPLGPLPKTRADSNCVVLRHGYIVAEFGDVEAVDPTFSVAKSYLSTLLGLTIDRGLIGNVDERVAERVHDGGYDSEHNAKVTWRHHVTQTSEWEGTLFSKPSTFIGKEAFGNAASKPRDIQEPGSFYEYNDVRINRMALSMLRLWKRPLPEVLKTEIMDPIGASNSWVYHAYDNAMVDVDGTKMPSISGGTRWGGGLWISTLDHARFGLLILREGRWADTQVISKAWLDEATKLQGKNPEYGYLWWLNTKTRWLGSPASAFSAQGAGGNSIWVDREHDLVIVWRWAREGDAQSKFYRYVIQSILPESK